jgi:hypothetical protein
MKKYSLFAIIAVFFIASAPALIFAQEMAPEKAALYTKYFELKKGGEEGQKQAYEVAKEFLQKFGNDDDQYVKAVKTFVAAYEKAQARSAFLESVQCQGLSEGVRSGSTGYQCRSRELCHSRRSRTSRVP